MSRRRLWWCDRTMKLNTTSLRWNYWTACTAKAPKPWNMKRAIKWHFYRVSSWVIGLLGRISRIFATAWVFESRGEVFAPWQDTFLFGTHSIWNHLRHDWTMIKTLWLARVSNVITNNSNPEIDVTGTNSTLGSLLDGGLRLLLSETDWYGLFVSWYVEIWNYVEALLIHTNIIFNHLEICCWLLFSWLLVVCCGKVWLRGGGKAQTQPAEKASLDFFGAGVVRSSQVHAYDFSASFCTK